jgi:hypothetical protein
MCCVVSLECVWKYCTQRLFFKSRVCLGVWYVVVVFQSIFHFKTHQNNIYFYFFKLFLTLVY